MKRQAWAGTQALEDHSEAPRASRVWRGALLPLQGARVLGSRLPVGVRVSRPVS